MKYFLFGYHDSWPMNKHILLIFAHFGLKTTTFLNAHKNYRCKVRTLNLNGMIALFILNLKKYFYWDGRAQFLGDRWKNRAKMENAPNSGMFRGNISSFPWNTRACLVTYFWHITFTFSFRNHQIISKNCIFA